MSASDLAAVVVVIVATLAAAALVVAAWNLRLAARRLRRGAAQLEAAAEALRAELLELSGDARRSLERAEDQLDRAGQVVEVIEQASKMTYRTVANPMIKAAAVASGVRRGANRLRQNGEDEPDQPAGRPRRNGEGKDRR